MKMKVGLAGKMGSGKSTVASLLHKQCCFAQFSLAEPIGKMVNDYFGLKKGDPGYRELMQKIGTDWFRSIDEDIWVNYLIKSVAKYEYYVEVIVKDDKKNILTNVVVDDVRFSNEAKKLLDNGWVIIYLDCPDEIRYERLKKRDGFIEENTINHSSENDVPKIKEIEGVIVIDASKSIEEVFNNVKAVLECK